MRTVKCNSVNNYGKKTNAKIRLQGFGGSDKGGADRAQGKEGYSCSGLSLLALFRKEKFYFSSIDIVLIRGYTVFKK